MDRASEGGILLKRDEERENESHVINEFLMRIIYRDTEIINISIGS